MPEDDKPSRYSIEGGAGPAEAAAIVAAIAMVLEEEAARRSVAPQRSRRSAWVRAELGHDRPSPVSSAAFDATPAWPVERPGPTPAGR